VGLLRILKEHDIDFVIIGGVAAALRGSPVVTYDLDVCAPLDEPNLLRILEAIRHLNPVWRQRPDIKAIPEKLQSFRGAVLLTLRTDLGAFDVLGDLPGVGSFEDAIKQATTLDVSGLQCRVLNVDGLIASKSAANRAKDKIGVMHLEAIRRRHQNPDSA
jgi:hypothetical protein